MPTPYDPGFAARFKNIPPFHVMELLARAQKLESAGRDIIHMEVGEPDFPTPAPIIEAAQAFIAQGQVRYTPASGLPSLRESLSRFYAQRFSADVSPDRIIITAGASGALLLAIAALSNPGDEWLLTDPGYPCSRQFVEAFNGKVRALQVDSSTNFQPSPEQIQANWTPSSKGLLLASPANPTGSLLTRAEMNALASSVRTLGGALIVDEIYQGLVYDQPASTVLCEQDQVFVVNSFSKYFGMTGWRLGWLVVPEGMTETIERLAQHLFIAPSTPAQHAALAAFSERSLEILEQRRQAFARRRSLLSKGLSELGFEIKGSPGGAFYLYTRVTGLCDDSMAFSQRLLEQAGVAITPGADFGHWRTKEHLRFAYTTEEARIHEALQRIQSIL